MLHSNCKNQNKHTARGARREILHMTQIWHKSFQFDSSVRTNIPHGAQCATRQQMYGIANRRLIFQVASIDKTSCFTSNHLPNHYIILNSHICQTAAIHPKQNGIEIYDIFEAIVKAYLPIRWSLPLEVKFIPNSFPITMHTLSNVVYV